MRNRDRVLQSLENVYRDAFGAADAAGDKAEMARLDLEYQRDQLQLEVLLDIRELLTPEQPDQTQSLLEKAQKLRRLTKLRP
jgi:Spy/CpxP family protein refolding chaperone